jgi:hypothetical protein
VFGLVAALLLAVHLLNLNTPSLNTSSEVLTFVLLGLMTGFHLVVFGMVSALYASHAYDARENPWLLILSRPSVRHGAAVCGGVLLGVGAILLVATGVTPLIGGVSGTPLLLPAGVSCFAGAQLLLGSLFVSLFAGQPEAQEQDLVMADSSGPTLMLTERGWPGQQEAALDGLTAPNLGVATLTDSDLAASD